MTAHPHALGHARAHWRLAVAALCGLAAAAFAWNAGLATRAVVGWDVAAAIFLLAVVHRMSGTTLADLKRIACNEDESAAIILTVMLGAIAASLAGVVAEIGAARDADVPHAVLYTALGVTTLCLSWLCMHVSFALHYAHRFYGDRDRDDAPDGGLAFPEAGGAEARPGYLEFAYFAFCIGMTCQVSDVVVLSRALRRVVTVHAVLSFFYNIFILGLAVNLFSGLTAH